jgi:hypothetical protein
MAVTTENSDQIDNSEAIPQVLNAVHDSRGRLRVKYFSFTQGAAAGDANSLVNLVQLPQGRIRLFTTLSLVRSSAFGVGRTLDIGITAHKNINGTAVAATVDTVADGLDVAAAGNDLMGAGTNALPTILVENFDGEAVLQAKCLGDTLPAGATLSGWIVFAQD